MASAVPGVRVNVVRWVDEPAPAAAAGTVPVVPPTTAPAPLPPIIGGLLVCHGYGHYCALLYDWLAARLRTVGIATFGIEHMGHGKSEGLPGYLPDFDALVTDVLTWAALIKERHLGAGLPLFGYGESLGGGIAVHAALREPHAFAGLTLFAPMLGIADGAEPPAVVQWLGRAAAWLMPTAAVAPVKDLLPMCFRDPSMEAVARADPHRYSGRMRLGTAFALKGAMDDLSTRLAELSTPFLLTHGTGDLITSHVTSHAMFDAAAATDKTLALYEGAYHVMWLESLDTRERLMHDWLAWLLVRCSPARRAALPLPVATLLRRPLGSTRFAEVGHPLSLFSLATHGHLYTASHPRDTPHATLLPAARILDIHSPAHPRHHLYVAPLPAAAAH